MGGLYRFRGDIAVFIVQQVPQVQLFAVLVGQLVQGGLQRFRQDGQQHRVLRQVHHPSQYRIDLRLARRQLRPCGARSRHLQLGGLQLLLALLVFLFVFRILLFLLFQLGPAVGQLLFPVRDLLPGVRQFVGGIGQLLLGIRQLLLGVGYLLPCLGYLLIEVVRHLLHPVVAAGNPHRLQRCLEGLRQLVIFIGVAVEGIAALGGHIQLGVVFGGKILLRHVNIGVQGTIPHRGAAAAGHIHIHRGIHHPHDGINGILQVVFQIVQRVGGGKGQRLSHTKAVFIGHILVDGTFIGRLGQTSLQYPQPVHRFGAVRVLRQRKYPCEEVIVAQRQAVHEFTGIDLLYTVHRLHGGNVLFAEPQGGKQLHIHGMIFGVIVAGGIPHIIAGGPHPRKKANPQRYDQ